MSGINRVVGMAFAWQEVEQGLIPGTNYTCSPESARTDPYAQRQEYTVNTTKCGSETRTKKKIIIIISLYKYYHFHL